MTGLKHGMIEIRLRQYNHYQGGQPTMEETHFPKTENTVQINQYDKV